MEVRGVPVELSEEKVVLGGHELSLLRPRDSEELLDEEAFEREEFLPYWAELWPSALALARAVQQRPLRGARVLELGCGLGLPSIVAALAGADVLATDWSEDALAFAALNAARNGAALETALWRWDEPARVRGAAWDLVLASDVLYERRNVDLLLALLPLLLEDGGEVLLADPARPPAAAFLAAAAADWRIESAREREPSRVSIHALRRRTRTSDVSAAQPPSSAGAPSAASQREGFRTLRNVIE